MTKICATKKSKLNPNVYSVPELRKMAIKAGHSSAMVKNANKSILCDLLNIKWVGNKIVTKSNTLTIYTWAGRDCVSRPSAKNPTAFTKEELVLLAVKHLKMTKSVANSHKKTELCHLLKEKGVKPKKAQLVKEAKAKAVKKSKNKDSQEPIKKKKSKSKTKPVKPKKSVAKKSSEKKKSPTKKSPTKKSPKGDCIKRSKLPLKSHQREVVEFLKKNRGIIAAFETGTGKTLTAVTASQCYLDENPKGKVVIVTPKSLQENFKKELKAYGANPKDKRYEFYTIRNFATTFDKKECGDDVFLIIDEAHNFRTQKNSKTVSKVNKKTGTISYDKSISAVTTAIKCGKSVNKVLLMTATPIYNSPEDILVPVALVKGVEPLSKTEFKRMGAVEICEYFKDTIIYYENPESEDYPTLKEHTIRIVMDQEYYTKYREVELRKSHLWSSSNPFRFLTGVRQATNAFDPNPKVDWTMEKLKEGKKTVVYSAFKTFGVKKVQSEAKKLGIKYVEVTGDMSMEDRNIAVKKYNSGKANVLFITKAGGEGLDLKGTQYVILLEKSWNRPNEEQIIGRARRYKSHTHLPKSQQKVDVYHLLLVKPVNRDKNDGRESADIMLENITQFKTEESVQFQILLRSVSLGYKGKCPPSHFDMNKLAYVKKGKLKGYNVELRLLGIPKKYKLNTPTFISGIANILEKDAKDINISYAANKIWEIKYHVHKIAEINRQAVIYEIKKLLGLNLKPHGQNIDNKPLLVYTYKMKY